MDVSVCVTDDDYEAWRAVRLAVVPESRCPTVDELRAQDSSDRLLLLAVKEGDVVGSGIADRAETAGGFVAPRVLSGHRRIGVGSALLRALADHCSALGLSTAVTSIDDEGSLAFATHFGFVEVDREVEQLRRVGDEPAPTAALPAGVEVVEAGQRPELWAACFETFGREVLADFAVYTPLQISAERWNTDWRGDPMFLALYEGEVIGCAGLNRDTDRPERAENALTAVGRTWRGRGIASHLKRRALHWAALNGLEEIYTWTQAGNSSMRRLNEHLDYVTTRHSVKVSRALPLTPDGDKPIH